MKPQKKSADWPWRPDLLVTPACGGVQTMCDLRPTRFGDMPWLTPFFHRPKRRPHLVPPFGLN